MKRPYIALGVTQQGRIVPTLLQRAQARAAGLVRQHLIDDDPKDVPPWQAPPAPEVRLRQGWELEPIDPPHPWRLYLLVLTLALVGFALGGCTALPQGPDRDTTSPIVYASCPPLADMRRTDADALSLRVAEVERWYAQCRAAALGMPQQYRHRVPQVLRHDQ